MNTPELIKDTIEPIKNIDFHVSPIGILSNSLFKNIYHVVPIIDSMRDLLRIIDPNRMSFNILHFKALRDEPNKPNQTRSYYHNKMKKIFSRASLLLINMTPKDEVHYGIFIDEIKEVLNSKKLEYEIDTYISDMIKNKMF